LTNYVVRATKDVDLYYSCFILDILLNVCDTIIVHGWLMAVMAVIVW